MRRFHPNQKLATVFGRRLPLFITILAIAGLGFAAVSNPAKQKASAAPYLSCSASGYIVRDSAGGTDIQAIDMVTGQGSAAGHINGRQLNAIGFNPKDNKYYAWDLQNGTPVRVDSDFTNPQPFTISGYSGPTSAIWSGDVDTDGFWWFFNATHWYQVDLNGATPTLVASGTDQPAAGTEGTDWAFMPGTNKLYRAMDEGANIRIYSFDRTTHQYAAVGVVSNILTATDGDMGSVYADPNNNFYVSSHNSGKLFRIDLDSTAPFTAAELDAVDPNSNDGARCALATVPIDFGDAPSSYDTTIAENGPRHSVANFNIADSTAPLMLGTKIDVEEDGFPSSDASGDDTNHDGGVGFVDDERGVTHLVVTAGSSDPLTVPVRVTNTSAQAAVVAGWVDLDDDGVFETNERVTQTVAAGFSGYIQLAFPAPPAPYSSDTFARFRIFAANDTSDAAANLLPTGPANGGEVEDVHVQLGTYSVTKTADPAAGTTIDAGSTVTYTLTIKNTGATGLSNLKIDDDLTDVLDDATVVGTPAVNPSSAGSASVTGNTLEFIGNVPAGQTVTVKYAVKVKDTGTLGNSKLNNYVLAAQSASCSPQVANGKATVSNSSCQTTHTINGLANTGYNTWIYSLLALCLILAGFSVAARRSAKTTYRN